MTDQNLYNLSSRFQSWLHLIRGKPCTKPAEHASGHLSQKAADVVGFCAILYQGRSSSRLGLSHSSAMWVIYSSNILGILRSYLCFRRNHSLYQQYTCDLTLNLGDYNNESANTTFMSVCRPSLNAYCLGAIMLCVALFLSLFPWTPSKTQSVII